jgi:hypothetical protein
MIPLLPVPPPKIREPLENVVERAAAAVTETPPWIVVEDTEGRWLHELGRMPACDRARSVIAVISQAALVQAVRLGMGGALWLPPSTAAMTDAFVAAAGHRTRCRAACDASLGETIGLGSEQIWVATWQSLRFWRRHLGAQVLTDLLRGLAEVLGVAPVVLPWPALVIPDCDREMILAAATELNHDSVNPLPEIELVELTGQIQADGVVAAALRAVASAEQATAPLPELVPQPVCELPSGHPVGWWATRTRSRPPDTGWLANPAESIAAGFRWRLRSAGGTEQWVDDLAGAEQIVRREAPATRLPGWAALGIGPGTPAGLLVRQLAEQARSTGAALWVPLVNQSTLRFLLRLRVTLWVDGPAVPG